MLKNILNFSGTLTTETTPTPGGSSIILPASSLDNEVVRFNGLGGNSIQGSNVFINDTQGMTGVKALTISAGAVNPGSDTTLWVRDSDNHLLFGAVDLLEGGGGGTGDVVGSASSTDNAIARFDGTTGKIIQNSGVGITDSQGIIGAKYLQILQSSANPGDAFSLWFNNVDSTLRFGSTNIQNTGGDVFSSETLTTDNGLVRFDGISGKLIQDSVVGITDTGVISGVAGTVFTNQTSNPFDAKTLWLNSSNELFLGNTELTDYITTPTTVVDNFIPRWNGTTGRNIQSSLVSISDAGAINIGNSLVKGYLSIEGNPAQYLDLTNNIVAVGRSIGNVSSNSVLVGTSGASFASNNSIIVGNNSCQSAQPTVVDLLCFGNDCGSGNGSKTIAIGNRISLTTVSSSLGADNIIMGHDVDVRNSTSGCVVISNSSRLQGLRSVVIGTNNKVNGNDNLVMGYNTLAAITTDVSSNNVLLGSSILPAATSATGCIIIGSTLGGSVSSFISNCLWIDADGIDAETNTTRIGKSTKTNCYIAGIYGAGAASSITQKNVKINSDGRLVGTFETRPYGCHTISISNVSSSLTPIYTISFSAGATFKIIMGGSPSSYFSSDGLFMADTTAGSIKYVGASTILAKYTFAFTHTNTGGASASSFYLLKNNVVVPNSVATAGYLAAKASSLNFIVSLSTNDVLEIGSTAVGTSGTGSINVFTENRFVEIIG